MSFAPDELALTAGKPNDATGASFVVNLNDEEMHASVSLLNSSLPGGANETRWSASPSSFTVLPGRVVEVSFTVGSMGLDPSDIHSLLFGITAYTSNSLVTRTDLPATLSISSTADPTYTVVAVVGSPTFDITWGGVEISPFDYDGLPINEDIKEDNFGLTLNGSMASQICSVRWDKLRLKHVGECTVPETERAGSWGLTVTLGEVAFFSSPVHMNCKAGTFEDPKTFECLACPRGAACSAGVTGVTLESLPLTSGHWRASEQSKEVFPCRYGKISCPGFDPIENRTARRLSPDDPASCERDESPYCGCGYTGPLCAQCGSTSDGGTRYYFSWATQSCAKCGNGSSHAPSMSLLGILGMFLVLATALRKRQARKKKMTGGSERPARAVRKSWLSRIKQAKKVGNVKLSIILYTCQVRSCGGGKAR